MAKTETAADAPKGILQQARSDYDRGHMKERDNIRLAYEDLEFLSGQQWTKADLDRRVGRPTLTVNELPQFIHQITGDIRQMKPAIKVVPVDSGADEKVAELRGGLIRYIENRSDASAIYFRGADSQVGCGIGHWRVQTEYSDQTLNQEIRVGPVEDGVAVIWDPDAVLPTKEDATFCFVPVDMSRKAFEKKYPDKTPADWDETPWTHLTDWLTDDYVRVAEYWVKEATKKIVALGLDGAITDVTDADESVLAYHKAKGARIEPRDSVKICRYVITAGAVLEGPEDWPGPDIPIIPAIGEEIRIGRNLIRNGIVRHAKDSQRLLNFFHSAHAETVALQPKAPFLVTETNVAKYQSTWEKANDESLPYLPYTPDQHNGGAAPQRVQPPVSSQGVLDGLSMSKLAMREVIGIYDAGLGAKSNETSGKAILARQREGDVGSYLYIDNFSRSVRRTGQIINNLIPFIYDTERTIRIMGEDGKIDVLEINKAAGIDPESGETIFTHDLTVGSYDVVATVGPNYTTRREEAKEGMTAFVQASPESGPLILDLIAEAQDWPMKGSIAKRFRANLPPHIVKMEEMEKQGASPEEIQQFMDQQRQNQPPPPEVIESQAKLQQSAEQHQADLEATALEIEGKKLANEKLKIEIAQLMQAPVSDPNEIVQNEAELRAADTKQRTADFDFMHKQRMAELDYHQKRGELAAQAGEAQPDAEDIMNGGNPAADRHAESMQCMVQIADGLVDMGNNIRAGMEAQARAAEAQARAAAAPKRVIHNAQGRVAGVEIGNPNGQAH